MGKKMKMASLLMALLLVASIFAVTASAAPKQEAEESSPLKWLAKPYKAVRISDYEASAAPVGTVPYNIDMVNAESAENDGEGIYVAVLDTGLLSNYLDFFPEDMVDIKEEWGIGFTHDVWYDPDGEGNWSIEYIDGNEYRFSYGPLRDDRGFLTHDDGAPDAYGFGWGSGHGTHVTSIITGYRYVTSLADTWIEGVAPKVTIIPVLVLDDWIAFADDGNGWFWAGGTDEMVAAGIRYVGDLAKTYKVKIVINLSLGGPEPTDIIEEAIDYAIAQGCIVVASAGNEGKQGMGWPGAYPQVISAAAAGWTQEYGGGNYEYFWWWRDVPERLYTANYVYDPTTGTTYRNNGQIYLTDFSSRANKDLGQSWKDLDVAAPGAAIRGPYKDYGPDQWWYFAVWGTSQAAPHVSGIAALILQSHPDLTQAQVEKILKNAAMKVPIPGYAAYVSDVFNGFSVVKYTWDFKEAGSGFITADEAMKAAMKYR